MTRRGLDLAIVLAGAFTPAAAGEALTFHLMQIEQIIGGVEGDTTLQAVQLRMRSSFQNFVAGSSVWVRNATGGSPVRLILFPSGVSNGLAGQRILIASGTFSNHLDSPVSPDFALENLIPATYLAGGTMTFENGGVVYWRVSWGNYTGSTTGSTFNDADGDFGGPIPMALPSAGLQALRFDGAANAPSTSNEDDYVLTAAASTWTNNAGEGGTLIGGGALPCPADIQPDGQVDVTDLLALLSAWGPCDFSCGPADITGDGQVSVTDLLDLLAAWGPCP